MPKLPRLACKLLPLAAIAGLALSPPALASHTQQNFFEASSVLLDPATRPASIAQMQHLGVKAVRIELSWADVAPAATKSAKPSFAATDPASYAWGEYDQAVDEAVRNHWQVLLTVTSPVPRWATSNRKAPYITRPNASAFGEFMTAVGRHYGSKVSLFSIWNEPNHPAFLLPQWNKNGTPASPRIYRGLFQAAYTGLRAAGIAKPKVLFGETAPTGFDTVSVHREGSRALLHDVAPLLFLRSALCLSPSYRRAGSCGSLPIAGYAHHAYTLPAGPRYVPPMRDDVMIGVLSRLSRALDRAARAHAIPGHTQIYLTEFGVQSKPNKQLGVPVAVQAEFDAMAEHIAWANSRVAAFSQYLLRDDPLGGAPGASVHGGTVGFQTGLEYVNGRAKPLYAAWPLPLVVSKSHGGYSLWGLVRPALGPTHVTILVRPRGSNKYRTLKTVTTNSLGYWTLRSGVSGQLWRVRWSGPEGAYQGPPIKAR